MNEWKSVYRGRAERGDGFVYQYKLKRVAVPDVGAQTPFEYSIHPVSLDISKRLAHPSHLKVASVMK